MRHLHCEQRKVLIRRDWGTLQSRQELHNRLIARGFRRVCDPTDAGLVDGELEALPALKAGINKPSVPARAQVDDGERWSPDPNLGLRGLAGYLQHFPQP